MALFLEQPTNQLNNEQCNFSFQEDKQNDEAEKEKMDETAEPIAEANKVHSTGDSLPETEPMEA